MRMPYCVCFTVDQIYIKKAIISSIVNDSGNSDKKDFGEANHESVKRICVPDIMPNFQKSH